jgi:hypothetical protein
LSYDSAQVAEREECALHVLAAKDSHLLFVAIIAAQNYLIAASAFFSALPALRQEP